MLQEQSLKGLSEREAVAQRASGHGNDIAQQTGRTYWQIVREAVFPLVNTILYVLCIALLLLGQISEGLISFGVVLLNVLISVIQEARAKRLLDRITLLTRPKATVIRDGQERVVDPRELVQGDLLTVQAGDQIVVDGPVVNDAHLEVDESLLTGESVPVPKQAGDTLYASSFCLTGHAYYRAEKVGRESVAGQLTAGACTFHRVWTPLQRTINSIIQSLLLVALYMAPFLHPDTDLGTFAREETALGRRVLLFACFQGLVPLRTPLGEPVLPTDMIPLGMVSLSDELRPQVRETLAGFAQIGIQIKVISGDNPQTVSALAQQVGIAHSERLVSGSDLATMDDAHFAQAASQTTIFERITPEQKSRLVQALRDQQRYVAMVGDGVNDVLSLKQANLSIAMESGSQATRGVADMVLLDDSFAALPLAFAEGQCVRNGMRNVIKLFLTRISYLVLLLFIIPIAGGFPFAPKQASVLQFITASIISVAVVAWARPGLSSQKNVARSFVYFILPATFTQSLVGFAVYALMLQLASQQSGNAAEAQAVAQSALTTFSVLGGLLMVPFVVPPTTFWTGGSELSGDWRPTLLALGMLVVFLLIVLIPGVRAFFSLTPLDGTTYLLIAGAVILWGLLQRWLWRVHFLERFLQVE